MTMRLTLRTMLAYMDNILDPAEMKDIGGKIAASDFATTTVNRIRDAARNPEIGAPAVSGPQMVIDPNRVAEYLDFLMAPDQVEEFERNSLQSDGLLAELAASQKLLTLILGKPADVDMKSREQMYTLIDESKPLTHKHKPVDSDAAAAAAIGPAPAPKTNGASPAAKMEHAKAEATALHDDKKRDKLEVPEYLREEKPFNWMVPVAALLLIGLAAVIYNGWPEGQPVVVNPDPNKPVNIAPVEPVDKKVNTDKTATTEPGKTEPAEPAKGEPTTDPVKTKTVDPVKGEPVKVEPDKGEPVKVEPVKGEPVKGEPVKGEPVKGEPVKGEPVKGEPVKGEPVKGEPVKGEPVKGEPVKTEPAVKAVPKVEMGQFTSQDSVLVSYSADKGDWQRLRPLSVVVSGTRLISWPTFRSTIDLNDGIMLNLLGGAVFEFEAPDAQGIPQLRILSGKVVATAKKPGTKIALLIGKSTVIASFGKAEVDIGIDVRPSRPVGSDPEDASLSPSRIDAVFHVPSGKDGNVTFDDGMTVLVPEKIMARGTLVPLNEDGTEDVAWVKEDQISPLDAKARPIVEKAITPGSLVTLGLKELVEHRRSEVSLLALRCLIYVGEFEPLVRNLNNVDLAQRSRDAIVLHLIEAVQMGPETSKRIHDTLKIVRGDRADDMWRMMWGYTRAQLERGEAARLVENLDHTDLDFRLLAFWNLQEITGLTLTYRPELEKDKRAPLVAKWQQKLEQKQIVPK